MPDIPTLATTPTPSAPAAPANPPASAPSQQAATAPAQRVTPNTPEWGALTIEQRHAALRGPENPRARGHSPAVEQREAAAARAAGEPPPGDDPQAPAANTTEKHKIGAYEISEGELGEMMTRQAADDLRKATLPAAPESYEAKLPADLKLPAGQTYTFNQNDPSLVAARNWAHSKGLSQDEFSQVLGIYASHVAGEQAILAERSRQEILKAGVNAPQRMDAVGKWITGEMGEADAKPIRATIVTDAHLRFYEKMMQKISSQGAASFSQSHRAAPETNGIPGFEKMSFEQRRQAQDANAARRR
jgi:hypothetical protein